MNAEKPRVKHRRGGGTYVRLLTYIRWLDHTSSRGYKILSESASSARFFLKQRAIVQRKPEQSLNAAVIVVALQDGLITEEQWENELRTIHFDKARFNGAIDALFERIMGRTPDRSRQAIRQEAALMWACVKLPFTEEELQYLKRASAYKTQKRNGRDFNSEDRQRFYHQPLSFDDSWLAESAEEAKPAPAGELDKWLEESGLGRYGALPGHKQPTAEPIEITPNLEQIAHADQERIDAVAASLLADLDI